MVNLVQKVIDNEPLLWAEQIGQELYVFHRGMPIYKRWMKNGKKTQPSVLFNVNGWPNEEVY